MYTAMLANDQPNVCDRTAAMLNELGWEVHIVEPEQLLNDTSSLVAPDLVLIDIQMEDGMGFDLILKARRRFEDSYIIAATRGADVDLWPGLVKMCGADRYLVGPVSKSKLDSLLRLATLNGMLAGELALTPV